MFAFVIAVPVAADTTIEAGSFSLSFDAQGRPVTARGKPSGVDLLDSGSGGEGFYLRTPDGSRTRLPRLSLEQDDCLVARTSDGTMAVRFRFKRGYRHLCLRVAGLEGPIVASRKGIGFQINAGRHLRALDLDYMTEMEHGSAGLRIEVPDLWRRSAEDPAGGFALFECTDEADEDETLLRLWVEEKLPHPRLAGAWTLERARRWIKSWQERFAERDQLILAGRSMEELRAGVAFAEKAGMKQIYLFTDTWRTDPFWPETDLNWAVNRVVFPRGEADLRAFSDHVRSQGMYLALHYVSGGIGVRDPVYVGNRPDRRFASWGGGRLVQPASAEDTTLWFAPEAGTVPPGERWPAYPKLFDPHLVRVGDELIRVGSMAVQADGTWVLGSCRRAYGSTQAAAHPAGTQVAGLLLAYGRNLVPDNNSTLLPEVAHNYAGLLERCHVEHVEFDGAEIHAHDGRWGYRKFATAIYKALPFPTTAHDSSGRAPPAWFEYRLNSSRRVLRGSCPYTHGNYSVPVAVATPSRPATTLLDAHFTLSQGNAGGALGIAKPEPMFGVTPAVLQRHGLTGRFVEALDLWRQINRRLTDADRDRLNAVFVRPRGAATAFNRHLRSPFVPLARAVGDRLEVVPASVLLRPGGDIWWQHGQEHGAIGPRQFIKPGERVTLINPHGTQSPHFILRVLPAFDHSRIPVPARTGVGANRASDADFFVEGNDVQLRPPATAEFPSNVLLQPHGHTEISGDGFTTVRLQQNALILMASNPGQVARREPEGLLSWPMAVDMSQRRGIGLTVTGDNSGAMLLIKLGRRDYVVPIDFAGTRYVEIPHGEVSWYHSRWGWRMKTKSTDYAKVGAVHIGFGELPARAGAVVTVERLTALAEIPVSLENPIIRIGDGELHIHGVVPSGHILEYRGGERATVYDPNWNRNAELPVVHQGYVMAGGAGQVSISTPGASLLPWLEVQFITFGDALVSIPANVRK